MTYKDYQQAFLNSFERIGQEGINFIGLKPLPTSSCVENCADQLLELMFPGRCDGSNSQSMQDIVVHQLEQVRWTMNTLVFQSYNHECKCTDNNEEESRELTEKAMAVFLEELPEIRRKIKLDAHAGFDNDPAAKDIHEVILAYPFIKALTIHRVAHCLYQVGVPLLPRLLNEWAHSRTGIDIHPGASIGTSFFIDHGTGVVIGETTAIGDNVKIYQGVTLGALSFPKDACGTLIRGAKRHPTIEDNVTIYANATLLGDITIGHDSIIGSSVWLKHDVPPFTSVLLQQPETIHREIKRSSKKA
ncbi:MAG: serine O-acetyltransferase [Spirochaetia bacterium]|jgi:serine O-acetyltransferase|nr:serine O-acetyltransferase [Spirochaetia bacterium]